MDDLVELQTILIKHVALDIFGAAKAGGEKSEGYSLHANRA